MVEYSCDGKVELSPVVMVEYSGDESSCDGVVVMVGPSRVKL